MGARRRAPCRRPRRRARRRRHRAQAARHRDHPGVRRARRAQRATGRRRRRRPAPGGDRARGATALRPGARAHRRPPERAVGRRRGRAQLPADPRHVPVPHRPRPRRQPADVEQDRPDGGTGDEPPPRLPGGRRGRALGLGADPAARHQGGQRRGPRHPWVRRRRPAGGVERAPRAAAERAARADARRSPPVLRRPDQGPGAARQRPRRARRAVAHPARRLHRRDVARRRRWHQGGHRQGHRQARRSRRELRPRGHRPARRVGPDAGAGDEGRLGPAHRRRPGRRGRHPGGGDLRHPQPRRPPPLRRRCARGAGSDRPSARRAVRRSAIVEGFVVVEAAARARRPRAVAQPRPDREAPVVRPVRLVRPRRRGALRLPPRAQPAARRPGALEAPRRRQVVPTPRGQHPGRGRARGPLPGRRQGRRGLRPQDRRQAHHRCHGGGQRDRRAPSARA